MTRILIAALVVSLTACSAKAEPRCVFQYQPSGPTFDRSAPAPVCNPSYDMGYIDNESNPFTEFHFLRKVSQNDRDYFALHLRKNKPWRISNPKVEDDAKEPQ